MRMASFAPKRFNMEQVRICPKCDDLGYLKGTARSELNPALNREWTEVCPYCMPTVKYGNLQEKLSLAPKLLDYKNPGDEEK